MFSTQERRKKRLSQRISDTMSERQYNFIIGGCLIYGFILNALIVATCSDFFIGMNPWIFLISYFVLAFAGIGLTCSDSPLISFIGYNLVVIPIGAVLSICLPQFDTDVIFMAIIATGLVVLIMTSLATMFPHVFAGLGRTLFIALVVSLIGELLTLLFFNYTGTFFDWVFVVIFSLYIGYDWYRAQSFPKTLNNAIDSACDLYIDIINLFIRILQILGSRN